MFSKGNTYYFKYKGYKHDPYPYVYVFKVERGAVEGINLHYLMILRGGFTVDAYKPRPQKYWAWGFQNLRRLGFFGNLIDILKEPPTFDLQWRPFYKFIKYRFPWAVKGYRRYKTSLIRDVEPTELI